MLHRDSNVVFQFILSSSIMHNDALIEVSKVFNFDESHKWFLIAFFFKKKAPFTNCNTWGNDKYFFSQSFMRCDHCPHKIVMPHTIICLHIHTSWGWTIINKLDYESTLDYLMKLRCQEIVLEYCPRLWFILLPQLNIIWIIWDHL